MPEFRKKAFPNLYSPYSPERQWSLGHIDEPQRQISSEDLVT